jgi:hypothetical protein
MSDLVPWLLTIHILTVVAAFGPSLSLAFISAAALREPAHSLFAFRLIERLQTRLILPLALSLSISGGLLIWAEQLDLMANHWLLLAIGLYAVLILVALLVLVPTSHKIVKLGETLANTPATEKTANSPALQELRSLGLRARKLGIFLIAMVVLIEALMAGKPVF